MNLSELTGAARLLFVAIHVRSVFGHGFLVGHLWRMDLDADTELFVEIMHT